MKYLLLIILVFTSCVNQEWVDTSYYKTIKAKDQPIENQFSAGDYFFGNGSITKSQTVYYLYFTDGSSESVSRENYFKFDVGDQYYIKSGYYKNIEE